MYLPPPNPTGLRVAGLAAQTRKELLKGNYREVHWNWGSLLLGLGVLIAIEGPVNTYLRTGAALLPLLPSGCAHALLSDTPCL